MNILPCFPDMFFFFVCVKKKMQTILFKNKTSQLFLLKIAVEMEEEKINEELEKVRSQFTAEFD